jgi:putative nucleotidyltransferase with HDIG domain
VSKCISLTGRRILETETIADFIPVSVTTLVPADAAGMNLYRRRDNGSFALYCSSEIPLHQDDLDHLGIRGVKQLYIESGSRECYQNYLRNLIEPGDHDPAVSLTARTGALNNVVRDVLESTFKQEDTNETVAALSHLGSVTAEIVTHDEFAANDLFRVLHHDYATFSHSANVAFYAGMLADKLGLDQQDVQLITTGGLLHDLGKLAIDEKILSKPGRLDEAEFRAIKMHPTVGFEQLGHREDLTDGQLMMVYQHHERLDGKGYPVGVVEDEIHPWAKICAVVDVFEALTSYRPYRSPMPKTRALEILESDRGKAFDPEVLACWMEITNAFWER